MFAFTWHSTCQLVNYFGINSSPHHLSNYDLIAVDDGDFRLSLCNPSAKYEGGGTGDEGYSGKQYAIVGIKPATTPQHADPQMTSFFKWDGKETYQRTAADHDFDITRAVHQWLKNNVHLDEPFDYGVVVRKADGTIVKEMLPLNDDTKGLTLRAGRGMFLHDQPLRVGGSLADGSYVLEFRYRIGEGEWHTFSYTEKVMSKIKGQAVSQGRANCQRGRPKLAVRPAQTGSKVGANGEFGPAKLFRSARC